MTSEEIRVFEATRDRDVDYKEAALFEIAFQLAKLNEHFAMVDNSVFGGVDAKKEKEKQVHKT